MVAGVVLGRLDRGPVSVEGSVFRGREPDEDRVDLDLGALDSWSTRVWVRPNPAWTIQASHGFLHEPEQLEPGDQQRTNGSVSWFRQREGTHHVGHTSIYGRFEDTAVETEILLFPENVHRPHPGELVDHRE